MCFHLRCWTIHSEKKCLGFHLIIPLPKPTSTTFKIQYGWVDTAFKVAYALGFILIGWLIDRIGTKRGLAAAIGLWSAAGVASAFVGSFRVVYYSFYFGYWRGWQFSIKYSLLPSGFQRKNVHLLRACSMLEPMLVLSLRLL